MSDRMEGDKCKLIRVAMDAVKCSSCETVFDVLFDTNPTYDKVEYCPFCGDEVEGEDA